MIVDSSALLAVLFDESSGPRVAELLSAADVLGVGAPTLSEAGIVVTARAGGPGVAALERLLVAAEITVVPFTESHWRVARGAFERFGKGRHPAALNLGDCLSYATAKLAGQELLCLGDDFRRTDLALVDLGGPD